MSDATDNTPPPPEPPPSNQPDIVTMPLIMNDMDQKGLSADVRSRISYFGGSDQS